MAKMWAGRTDGTTENLADEFNASISFDKRLAGQDIAGSIAHARMLARQGIITESECANIVRGLESIREDLASGVLQVDEKCEDIHMFVEQILTERIGDDGKKLHTARSRNDQVALDIRLMLRDEMGSIGAELKKLIETLCGLAQKHADAIMPGYTHLQRAQPVLFGHHMMAYAMMLLRDKDRYESAAKRMNVSPIGAGALSGTTFPTDREWEARALGFDSVALNSMDAVSDRDFALDFLYASSVLMMHLSRFCEELILWSSWEFRFIEFSDAFTTGSSMMPQKKNPDMAELIRGKTGRVYGDLVSLLTTMKGLPLAYNKDMQEDKEPLFDAADTVIMCLRVLSPMLDTMRVNEENMLRAANAGFINATDLADYLVGKGLPFRDAYKISGRLVSACIEQGLTLDTFPLQQYRAFCPRIEEDVFDAIDLKNCVMRRLSKGGTSPTSLREQLAFVRARLSGQASSSGQDSNEQM